MVYVDKYKYEKIDFENVAFFVLLIVLCHLPRYMRRVIAAACGDRQRNFFSVYLHMDKKYYLL